VGVRGAAGRIWAARVTVAWAVLGATAGVCPMYTDAVYYAGCWADPDYAHTHGTQDASAGRVKLFGRWVYDGRGQDRHACRMVDVWTVGIGGVVAGLGAAVGVAVSRALPQRARRPARTDLVLWALLTGAVAAGLAAAGVPWENENGRGPWWYARQSLRRPGPHLLYHGQEGFRLLVFALPVGWALQVVAAGCGFRTSSRADPEQVADYRDRNTAEPFGAPDSGRDAR